MHPEIQRWLEARQAHLDRVWSMDLTPPQLATLVHILELEETNTKAIRTGLGNPQNFKVSLISRWLRTGMKMPGPPGLVFPGPQPRELVEKQFSEITTATVAALENREPGESVIDHPLMGRVSAVKLVELYASHFDYHLQNAPFGK